MRMSFVCNTNKDYVMINTVKVTLASGSILTIDRKETEYSIDGDKLNMVWNDCYLWAIDDQHIFEDDGAWFHNQEDIQQLFKGASIEFELEDDADENYRVDIIECHIWAIDL